MSFIYVFIKKINKSSGNIYMDIKKVYIDTRFKTADSKSDSDFYAELPRALNIPDKCVCYIDDIVIPVAWSAIDERNQKLYLQSY